MNSDTRNVSATEVTPASCITITQFGAWKLCFLRPSIAYGMISAMERAQSMLEFTVNMQNVLIPIWSKFSS